ncbi:GTPase Obg [Bienertia sinuspersici]
MFRIKVMQRQYGGPWLIMLKGDRGYHNHELLVYNEGHRQVSGLSPVAKKVVRDMTEARAKPGPILAVVKEQFPNLNPNKRHIYNCRAKLREEKAEGRNPAEQFLHLAVGHKYLFWIDSDEDDRDVINEQNFLIGWALMKDETEESYRWVMERLRNLIGYQVHPAAIVTDAREQNWQFTRRTILNEIVSHPFIYRAVYFDRFQEACARIDWGGEWCGEEHYMEIVADLFPIANFYRCSVMCFAVTDDGLNPNISVTILPWDAEPTLTRPTTELTIAHLGSYKHFIRLELDDDFPVPPISPIWEQLRTDAVAGWEIRYEERRRRWDTLTNRIRSPTNVVIHDSDDDDDG